MKSLKAQLMAAIAMTLVAALTIGSSTYAWFTMNGSVSATDMSVSAQTSSMYLVIGTTPTLKDLQDQNLSRAEAVNKQASLRPVMHKESVGSGQKEFTWQYYLAEKPSAPTATGSALPVEASVSELYTLQNTFYITTASGSDPCKNLRCTKCLISNLNDKTISALRVLVWTDDTDISTGDSYEFSYTNTTSTTVLADDVDKTHVIPVHVAIYYLGSDESVYTNNALNLANASVTLSFAVDDPS